MLILLETNKIIEIKKICKEKHCLREVRFQKFCSSCYRQFKKFGIRECTVHRTSECDRFLVRNWATTPMRGMSMVSCKPCVEYMNEQWSFEYPSCRSCGRTTVPHARKGYCHTCLLAFEAYGGPRQCQKCPNTTIRNFSCAPNVLCWWCAKKEYEQIFESFCLKQNAHAISQKTVLGEKIVYKCFNFLETGQVHIIQTINAKDFVVPYMASLYTKFYEKIHSEYKSEMMEKLSWEELRDLYLTHGTQTTKGCLAWKEMWRRTKDYNTLERTEIDLPELYTFKKKIIYNRQIVLPQIKPLPITNSSKIHLAKADNPIRERIKRDIQALLDKYGVHSLHELF